MGVSRAKTDSLLDILLVCFQAMKESSQDLVAVLGLSEVCAQPRIDIGSAFRAPSMAAIWSGETRFIGERG